jgi:hypothetical protein
VTKSAAASTGAVGAFKRRRNGRNGIAMVGSFKGMLAVSCSDLISNSEAACETIWRYKRCRDLMFLIQRSSGETVPE